MCARVCVYVCVRVCGCMCGHVGRNAAKAECQKQLAQLNLLSINLAFYGFGMQLTIGMAFSIYRIHI